MLDAPRQSDEATWAGRAGIWWRSLVWPLHWWGTVQKAGGALWPWRISGPVLIGALAALWYFGPPLVLGPIVITDAVVRADFVQSVVATGNVAAPNRVNVGSQITGSVVDVPVSEGQNVKTGDKLILLDDHVARAAVVLAAAAVAQAEARMRQMKELTLPSATAALTQAQATQLNAQLAYDRASKLAEQGYATKVTLDDAKKALDIAVSQVRNAEFQVRTDTPNGSDYVMAETQLDQARASLASANSQLSFTVITAPRDGILISRAVERGNIVQPSAVLMALSPTGDTELVVQIDEKNLGLISIGQNAIASADAFPKEQFPAVVVYINPGIDLQRASVQVKLRVPNPPTHLRQDMTISVDIEVARRPSALIVPTASVRGASAGQLWVLNVKSGRALRQPVKIGLVSAGKAEIVEGILEGDLIVPASATIKDGARIRARVAPVPRAS